MAEHVFAQVTGRCGSVLVRLIPAPRGTGIVSAPVPKKLLMMAGIDDCYTSARGCTATLGNFGKGRSFEYQCFRIKRSMLEYFNDDHVHFLIAAKATFDAISKTYSYLTPDLWKETVFTKSPYQVMCIFTHCSCSQMHHGVLETKVSVLFQEFTDHLAKTHTRVSVQRTQGALQAAS